MKFAQLVAANLLARHRVRSLLTVLSIGVAFAIFVYLATIRKAFDFGLSSAGDARLFVRNRTTLLLPLPMSYLARLRDVPGTTAVAYATFLGGIYKERKNFFGQIAVEPRDYLRIFPEFLLPKTQLDAWLRTRTGAVVGRRIAEKYGWHVGDKVSLLVPMFPAKSGGVQWTFDVVGIYDGRFPETDTNEFLLRNDYFDENRAVGSGTVGWYVVQIADVHRVAGIARTIDALFANSPYETKSEPEAAIRKGFTNQVADFGSIVAVILSAVFFTILLVAGNTMAQSVRERTSELAVLKAIGFSNVQVLGFVLSESLAFAIAGGAAGIASAWLAVSRRGDPTGILPFFYFPVEQLPNAIAIVLLLGILAGVVPAIEAMRLNAADALRRD